MRSLVTVLRSWRLTKTYHGLPLTYIQSSIRKRVGPVRGGVIDERVIVVHFLVVRIVALRMYRLDIWHYGLIQRSNRFLHTKAHHLIVKSWLVKKHPMLTHLTGRTNAGRYFKTAVIPFHYRPFRGTPLLCSYHDVVSPRSRKWLDGHEKQTVFQLNHRFSKSSVDSKHGERLREIISKEVVGSLVPGRIRELAELTCSATARGAESRKRSSA